MNKTEINKTIAQWMGKCWHDFSIRIPIISVPTCKGCGLSISRIAWQHFSNPDYCSDLNAVREAELKFIEDRGVERYSLLLHEEVMKEFPETEWIAQLAIASALTRATALYKGITENE